MVEIKYINGDIENVESVESDTEHTDFLRDNKMQMFIVFVGANNECMMIPREFVKSIRHIEV